MRILTLTITGLLALGSSMAMAQTIGQYNHDIRQLNTDVANNRADRTKDLQVYGEQRSDLNRDRLDRNADRTREQEDLAKGNYKGAAYWNQQRVYQNQRIALEKKDLAHTRRDVKADNARLAKDIKVRHNDVVKRNKLAR